MTMTDPIADMLTRIRNANTVGHETVEVPASNMKKSIAGILKAGHHQNNNEVWRKQRTRYQWIKEDLKAWS